MLPDRASVVIQGHRGCRAELPENSVAGFIRCAELRVDRIELDVVATADHQLLVSHDPFIHSEICCHPDGHPVSVEEEHSLNIYRMSAKEAQRFIIGSSAHPRFPGQRCIPGSKPLLKEAIRELRVACAAMGVPLPGLTIEIKSRPEWDGSYHPDPAVYASIFLKEWEQLALSGINTIQSFDPRILRALNELEPSLRLTFLTEDIHHAIQMVIDHLGFTPFGWAPRYDLIAPGLVEECARLGMELSTWTVNDVETCMQLVEIGVRNIITDDPALLLAMWH